MIIDKSEEKKKVEVDNIVTFKDNQLGNVQAVNNYQQTELKDVRDGQEDVVLYSEEESVEGLKK